MRTLAKTTIGTLAGAALLASLAGCTAGTMGSESSADASGASSSSSSIPAPVASIPALTGSDTQVTLDQSFVDALGTLGLTPGTIGEATFENGALDFPITGGSITYWSPDGAYRPYVQGILLHTGSGFSLSAGGTTVALSNFTVNPGDSELYGDVAVNGTVAASQAPLFDLHGGTLKPLQLTDDTAILEGTTVHVSDTAAGLLNKTFDTDAVQGGLLVGVAKITVNTD